MRLLRPLTLLALLSAVTVVGVVIAVVGHRDGALDGVGERRPSVRRTAEEDFARSLLAEAAAAGATPLSARAPAMWVRVGNSRPLWNANAKYLPNDPCFVSEGARVDVVRIGDGYVVLRYSPTHLPLGSNCPAGTLFRLPVPRLASAAAN
jgi:hypothetical protein